MAELYRDIEGVYVHDHRANGAGYSIEYDGLFVLLHELEEELWERLFADYGDEDLPEFTDEDYVDYTDNEFFDSYAYDHTVEVLDEWIENGQMPPQ